VEGLVVLSGHGLDLCMQRQIRASIRGMDRVIYTVIVLNDDTHGFACSANVFVIRMGGNCLFLHFV
jgi:hypothetical protein